MSGFTLPTSRPVTQAWGAEFDDWDGDGIVDYPGGFYHSIGWNGHNGIDYGCRQGDPIEAIADGVVSFAAWAGNHWLLSGGGNAILVEHAAYGIQSEYLHLSRFAVTAGQAVSKGQVIGYAGKTGAATAEHLHLGALPLTGINVNNRMRGRIDPTPYLYGGLAAQGSVTPEEGFMANASEAQLDRLVDAADRIMGVITDPNARILTTNDLDDIALAILKRECDLIDPTAKTQKVTGTTTLAKRINWMPYNFEEARQDAALTRERVAAVEDKLDTLIGLLTPAGEAK